MLRASRVLRQAIAHTKITTGIVGLDVVPNGREVLIRLSEKVLGDLRIIPEGVAYRTDVEKLTKHRLEAARKHENVSAAARA